MDLLLTFSGQLGGRMLWGVDETTSKGELPLISRIPLRLVGVGSTVLCVSGFLPWITFPVYGALSLNQIAIASHRQGVFFLGEVVAASLGVAGLYPKKQKTPLFVVASVAIVVFVVVNIAKPVSTGLSQHFPLQLVGGGAYLAFVGMGLMLAGVLLPSEMKSPARSSASKPVEASVEVTSPTFSTNGHERQPRRSYLDALVGVAVVTVLIAMTLLLSGSRTAPRASRYETLAPASFPSLMPECSMQLVINGPEPGPLFCSNGLLNIDAWKWYASIASKVMSLGRGATWPEVANAMCTDFTYSHSTGGEERSAAILADSYYRWGFTSQEGQWMAESCG